MQQLESPLPAAARPSALEAWIAAARPRTLTIAAVPVFVGAALARMETAQFDPAATVAALVAAVLIQVGTNMQNDLGDFERGADTAERLGPPRVTSMGWIAPGDLRLGAGLAFGLACLVGSYLAWRGGWPILVAGLASIAAGIAYTSGPRPIAYTGLGELFVLVFFGVVAVCGTYYLEAARLSWSAAIAGVMIGMLAAAILVVNNYRDIEVDRRVGKHTLAACFGRGFAKAEYTFLLLAPFALLPALGALQGFRPSAALPLAALPCAFLLARKIVSAPPGRWLNRLLGQTAGLQLGFALLLTASFLL
jgi:1,4-dihydroxy-2-naphthoate octaprenyltransferase